MSSPSRSKMGKRKQHEINPEEPASKKTKVSPDRMAPKLRFQIKPEWVGHSTLCSMSNIHFRYRWKWSSCTDG